LCVRAPRTTMAERSEDTGGIDWSRTRVFGDALNKRSYSAAGLRSSAGLARAGVPARHALPRSRSRSWPRRQAPGAKEPRQRRPDTRTTATRIGETSRSRHAWAGNRRAREPRRCRRPVVRYFPRRRPVIGLRRSYGQTSEGRRPHSCARSHLSHPLWGLCYHPVFPAWPA